MICAENLDALPVGSAIRSSATKGSPGQCLFRPTPPPGERSSSGSIGTMRSSSSTSSREL